MASAACCFSEEQFRNLCAELQSPGPTGHYKAFGVLDDFPPDLLADVSMDFNYRKEWDEFVKELYERECSREAVVYWEVESPSPKFNRDVSFPERHHYSAFKVFLCPVTVTQWWYVQQKGFPTYLKNMVNTCDNYPRRS
ncbi:phosphatidylcholine transfer protein-like isoform X4 [Pseudorca crassidens]|uniref:phosphatidylcholine transfer protein-like isoform X4 n=1 Tax=Pseudorca crassidens TaxID=82174 RepID=UPI00352D9C1B